ncbi:MAG: hypothetical protein ABIA59_01625 [Candidatus Latescibacterota bacterium]
MTKLIWKLLFVLCLLFAMAPSGVIAETITIQAESFSAWNDLGFNPIQSTAAPACAGGYMLTGIDMAGEWVEYQIDVAAFGSYTARMLCRGDFGVEYTFGVTLTGIPSGEVQNFTLRFTGLAYG